MVPVENEQEEMQGKGRKPVEGERKEAGDQLARAGDEAAKAAEKAKTEAARAVLELTGMLLARAVSCVTFFTQF